MKKMIFNSDCVLIKEYIEARFNMSIKPIVYVCGRNIKLPIDSITSLDMVLENETSMLYSLYIEDGETIEELVFDGLRFELHTDVKPETLMEDDNLRKALNVGIFAISKNMNLIGIEKAFEVKGFKINHSFIYKRMCPYKTFITTSYFILMYPQFSIEEELKTDLGEMNQIIASLVLNNESKSKSFV